MEFVCDACGRGFGSHRGLSVHRRSCRALAERASEAEQSAGAAATSGPEAVAEDAWVPVPGSHRDYASRRRERLMSMMASRGAGSPVERRSTSVGV